MTRFLHTGDRQLGMTWRFFSEGVQERFAQSRLDIIRELGRIAKGDQENESTRVSQMDLSRPLQAACLWVAFTTGDQTNKGSGFGNQEGGP